MQTNKGFWTSYPHWPYYLTAAVVLGIAAFLFLMRLQWYPALWYDDGSQMHVSKNYALHGVYADYSSEGNRFSGPVISLGPTVILPIAWSFNIFGVNVFAARLVMAAYGMLAVAALFALGSRFMNYRSAFLVVILCVLFSGLNVIHYARSALGELVGMLFIFSALLLWLRWPKSIQSLIVVGLLFGLGCITKPQYAPVILPSLLLCWFADLLWYRRRGWRYFVIPGIVAGIVYAGWVFYTLYMLGANERNVAEDIAQLRATTGYSWFLLSQVGTTVGVLLGRSIYGFLFVPAVLYSVYLSRNRSDDGQAWGIITIIIVMGIAFYLVSIGWVRYAFIPVTLAALPLAKIFHDLTDGFSLNWSEVSNFFSGTRRGWVVGLKLAVIAFLVVAVLIPVPRTMRGMMNRKDNEDVFKLAEYMNANVPKDAQVETVEQELLVLTDHRYHYPPDEVFNDWPPPEFSDYDFSEYVDPNYIVVGPWGKKPIFFVPELLDSYTLIYSSGEYDLYQRREES
jgi:hypothetical protein